MTTDTILHAGHSSPGAAAPERHRLWPATSRGKREGSESECDRPKQSAPLRVGGAKEPANDRKGTTLRREHSAGRYAFAMVKFYNGFFERPDIRLHRKPLPREFFPFEVLMQVTGSLAGRCSPAPCPSCLQCKQTIEIRRNSSVEKSNLRAVRAHRQGVVSRLLYIIVLPTGPTR